VPRGDLRRGPAIYANLSWSEVVAAANGSRQVEIEIIIVVIVIDDDVQVAGDLDERVEWHTARRKVEQDSEWDPRAEMDIIVVASAIVIVE
jgi:hypothetical protein